MAEWLWRVTQAFKLLNKIEVSHGLCPRGFESPSVHHVFAFYVQTASNDDAPRAQQSTEHAFFTIRELDIC